MMEALLGSAWLPEVHHKGQNREAHSSLEISVLRTAGIQLVKTSLWLIGFHFPLRLNGKVL